LFLMDGLIPLNVISDGLHLHSSSLAKTPMGSETAGFKPHTI
jgi:hypothetical protein